MTSNARHERQPKPVNLSRAPWDSAGAGNTADNALTQPKTQAAHSEAQKTAFTQTHPEARGSASPRDLATTPATRYHKRKE